MIFVSFTMFYLFWMFLVRVRLCVCASVFVCSLDVFCLFSFRLNPPGARRPFFFALSLRWVIFFRLCVCYLFFVRFLLFIYWLVLRSSRLLVLSLVRPMFYGCVDLSLTFIWFGGREAEYDVVPVRELMIMTPFPDAASRVWLVGAACVWVLWLILIICVAYCWHCRVCWWAFRFYVLFMISCSGYIPVFTFSVFLTVVFLVFGVSSTSMASPSAMTSRRFSSSVAPLLVSGIAWFNSCKVSGCH